MLANVVRDDLAHLGGFDFDQQAGLRDAVWAPSQPLVLRMDQQTKVHHLLPCPFLVQLDGLVLVQLSVAGGIVPRECFDADSQLSLPTNELFTWTALE